MNEEGIEWELLESSKVFWNPKVVDECLVGEVIEITKGRFGDRFTIKTDDLEVQTPSHKVLQSRMVHVVVGSIVKIIYKGELAPKVRGENTTKLYEVYRKKDI